METKKFHFSLQPAQAMMQYDNEGYDETRRENRPQVIHKQRQSS